MQHEKSLATQDVICEKALELFRIYGYEKTTISDICQSANLTSGAIYHHFKSKEGILFAIVERISGSLPLEEISNKTVAQPSKGICQVLHTWTNAYEPLGVDFSKAYLKSFIKDPPLGNRAYSANLIEYIKAAQEFGSIIKDLPAKEIAEYFFVVGYGVLYKWCQREGSYSLAEEMDKWIALATKAVVCKEI